MKGHLHLTCGFGDDRQPCLKEQSFRAPFHLSKPHLDAGALVVNVVNPTAGLFDGDELDLAVRVECGSHLVLTTPSASRVFRSRSGQAATLRQAFHVEDGAMLEFLPEPLIPHAGAIYEQNTDLRLAAKGNVLFFEWLAPGRVASGEVFAYSRIGWSTEVWRGGTLTVRERYQLTPDDHSLVPLQRLYPAAHYLGCFVAGDFVFPVDAVEALASPSRYVGWSELTGGGWAIKALCEDALATRKLMASLRTILHEAMGLTIPDVGRCYGR
ncbi:MAG: urease accessory protein UreD [Roseimicrobium sp.]